MERGAKREAMRRKNIADMTITEQIESIKEQMCNDYCKYPDTWDAEKEGCELWDSDLCAKECPLNRL